MIVNPSRTRSRGRTKVPRKAVDAFETFHGGVEPRVRRIGKGNRVLIEIGRLREVVYQPRRGDRRGPAWVHKVRGARLAATPDGKQLVIVIDPKHPMRFDPERGIVGG